MDGVNAMSGLPYNKEIAAPTEYVSGTSGTALKTQFNNNQTTLHNGIQDVENRLENSLYELFGSGVLDGMEASIGTGLSVDVTAGYALIGIVVDYAGGTVSVEANQSDGKIYFAQNGLFYTSPPSGVAYFEFCSYVSDASSVTSVGSVTKVMPCRLTTITDTFTNVAVGATHTLDYLVDHSSLGEFVIPGFITVSVSPSNVFTIEHIDMEDDTGTTFKVRVSREAAYQSAYEQSGLYAECDITFTRTGIMYM